MATMITTGLLASACLCLPLLAWEVVTALRVQGLQDEQPCGACSAAPVNGSVECSSNKEGRIGE